MTSAASTVDMAITNTQGFSEESSTGPAIVHPGAPRMEPNELPATDESAQQHTVTVNHGIGQWIPDVLLFRNDIRPKIDSRLVYRNGARAVAHPSFTCMPETPAYLWGAVGNPVLSVGANGPKAVDFERSLDPATEPQVARMIIRTDTNNMIIVDAGPGWSYVTVVDVQKAVIDWMKTTRTMSGTNNLTKRFSKSVRMVDDDETEAEVEIWVWKGLTSLTRDMVQWHLHLCEA